MRPLRPGRLRWLDRRADVPARGRLRLHAWRRSLGQARHRLFAERQFGRRSAAEQCSLGPRPQAGPGRYPQRESTREHARASPRGRARQDGLGRNCAPPQEQPQADSGRFTILRPGLVSGEAGQPGTRNSALAPSSASASTLTPPAPAVDVAQLMRSARSAVRARLWGVVGVAKGWLTRGGLRVGVGAGVRAPRGETGLGDQPLSRPLQGRNYLVQTNSVQLYSSFFFCSLYIFK